MREAKPSRRCSSGYCSPRPADPPHGTRSAMGPGIVDARALLEASFDVGLGRVGANSNQCAGQRRLERRLPGGGGRGCRRRARRRAGLAPVRTGVGHRAARPTAPGPLAEVPHAEQLSESLARTSEARTNASSRARPERARLTATARDRPAHTSGATAWQTPVPASEDMALPADDPAPWAVRRGSAESSRRSRGVA